MALRYLSGVQPSGQLHLGNYFGAIRRHIEAQDGAFYFIANYHAMTTIQNGDALRKNIQDAACTYLALGLDPERATFYRQSDIPEVTELMWMLATVTGMGLLERATSFKDKKERGIAASMGLFNYPVLMAADILLFDADVVPVGPDQIQHVEMTRDMATYFNQTFGETFKLPKHELGVPVPVPGLDGAKMSKSYGNTIPLFARGKELKKLVMSIKTDSTPLEEPKNPDTCPVFALYKLFANDEKVEEMRHNYLAGNYGYGHAKLALLSAIQECFATAYDKYDYYQSHLDEVEDILRYGAKKARAVAEVRIEAARRAVGLK